MNEDQQVTQVLDVKEVDSQLANSFNVSVRYSNDKTLMAIQIETTFQFTGESIAGILNELANNIRQEADLAEQASSGIPSSGTDNNVQSGGSNASTGCEVPDYGNEERSEQTQAGSNPSGSSDGTGQST